MSTFPLGGNRFGTLNTYRNLTLTMLLGGLWHGASYNFILWGAYHAGLLCAEKALRQTSFSKLIRNRALKSILFFPFICFGWFLFAIPNLSVIPQALNSLLALQIPWHLPSGQALILLLFLPLLVMEILEERQSNPSLIKLWPKPIRALCYAGLLLSILYIGVDLRNEFIYFQF